MAGLPGAFGSGGWPPRPSYEGKGKAQDNDRHAANQYQGFSHASSSTWYCIDCDLLVLDPFDCFNRNHIVQAALHNGLSGPSLGDSMTGSIGPEEISTLSNTDNVFSTGGSFSSSGTHGSIYSDYSGQVQPHGGPSMPNCTRPNPVPSASLSLHRENQPLSHVNSTSNAGLGPGHLQQHCPLSIEQEAQLNSWLQRCQAEGHPPTGREIELLASLQGLDHLTVHAWFQSRLQAGGRSETASQFPTPVHPNIPGSEAPGDSVISEVTAFAKQRNSKPCDNSRARSASPSGRLICLFGCGYSTDDWDDWRRHLETTYPQNFWHCVLCRDAGNRPWICHRIDKFNPHVRKDHGIQDRESCIEIREKSKVFYIAEFPGVCPFWNYFSRCSYQPNSWEDFVRHCLEHLRNNVSDGPWQLRYQQHKDFDQDEGDNDGSQSTSGSSGYFGTHSASKIGSKSGSHQTKRRHRDQTAGQFSASKKCTNADANNMLHLCAQTALRRAETSRSSENSELPTRLIDVEQYVLVPSPEHAKYLALDYSWAEQRCAKAPQSTDSTTALAVTRGGSCNSLPPHFQKVMALAREMGYQYLWIDVVCEGKENPDIQLAVYKKATLIIVIVGLDPSADRIWHLTCHFRNLKNVLAWAKDSITALSISHVQNLGHGSFGIVDEVRLAPTLHSFARKMCTSYKDDGVLLKPEHFQEIEVLQRLDHPNIPRFVAAYVQRHHLNILMSPVADCNLKEYLARPWNWIGKRKSIRKWFYSLSSALEHMHSMSCKHKDIKPANILVSGQEVLLSDFGIAKDFSMAESGSEGPAVMTPKYCAPEVAQQKRRGRPADIFSLGCVFAEMLTIDVGLQIASLSQYMEAHKKVSDSKTVYCRYTSSLRSWLRLLGKRAGHVYQRTLIELCVEMLHIDPLRRPTAQQVRKVSSLESEQIRSGDGALYTKHVFAVRRPARMLNAEHRLQSAFAKPQCMTRLHIQNPQTFLSSFKISVDRRQAQHDRPSITLANLLTRALLELLTFAEHDTSSPIITQATRIVWPTSKSVCAIAAEGVLLIFAPVLNLRNDSRGGKSSLLNQHTHRGSGAFSNGDRHVVVIVINHRETGPVSSQSSHSHEAMSWSSVSTGFSNHEREIANSPFQGSKMGLTGQNPASRSSYKTLPAQLTEYHRFGDSSEEQLESKLHQLDDNSVNTEEDGQRPRKTSLRRFRSADAIPVKHLGSNISVLPQASPTKSYTSDYCAYTRSIRQLLHVIYILLILPYLVLAIGSSSGSNSDVITTGFQHVTAKVTLGDKSSNIFTTPTTIILTISDFCQTIPPTPAPSHYEYGGGLKTNPTLATFSQNASLVLTIDCDNAHMEEAGNDTATCPMECTSDAQIEPPPQPSPKEHHGQCPNLETQDPRDIDNATYFPFHPPDKRAPARGFLEQIFLLAGHDREYFMLERCDWEHDELFVLSNATDYLGLLCYSDVRGVGREES